MRKYKIYLSPSDEDILNLICNCKFNSLVKNSIKAEIKGEKFNIFPPNESFTYKKIHYLYINEKDEDLISWIDKIPTKSKSVSIKNLIRKNITDNIPAEKEEITSTVKEKQPVEVKEEVIIAPPQQNILPKTVFETPVEQTEQTGEKDSIWDLI